MTGAQPSAATLTVENLAVRYGGVSAVKSVSFTVAPGQSVGLIGANGAGKTSTLRALMGLVPRAGGAVRFGSHDLSRFRRGTWCGWASATCRRAAASSPG